jgi:glycosyltransferase involved in cell wall biosynthesis
MNEVPRVTGIIIVLNGEAFLRDAIESVRAQSFDNWELLVVDDGSTDASITIARSYAETDQRIRVLGHPDRATHGMSATRNLGLREATGDFVAFLDADDAWLPEKLSEQVEVLDRYPSAAMVYGRTLIWHEWSGSPGEKDFYYGLGVAANALYSPPRMFFQLIDNVHQSPTTCNAMIRRDAAMDVGGFDASFRDMFEDQVFFAKLLLLYPVFVSDRCWAKYRQHDASASSRVDPAELQSSHLRYLRALRTFAIGRGKRLSRERVALEKMIRKIELSRLRARARRLLGA